MAQAQTIRQFIEGLQEVARHLTAGLESEIELIVCDGSNLQTFEEVDLNFHTEIRDNTEEVVREYAIIQVHHHPGESPGPVLRGVAADADEELRRLVEGDDG